MTAQQSTQKYAITVLAFWMIWPIFTMTVQAEDFTLQQVEGGVSITVGEKPFAEYIYRDKNIPRPHFRDVYAPNGIQVTRNYPPIEGVDRPDHATYHPGVWLTFGDISGADFWRNRAQTKHIEFVRKPYTQSGVSGFTVRNHYLSGEDKALVCEELCRYTFRNVRGGYLVVWDSEFSSKERDFYFGDQEEMGLGIRVATPISVEESGEILSSDGKKNEKEVWGQQADWCDYHGVMDGWETGVTLLASPDNFRRSWFHARDYGLLVANPFGRNAFTDGDKSRIPVAQGETLRLCFGLFVYSDKEGNRPNLQGVYGDFLKVTESLSQR